MEVVWSATFDPQMELFAVPAVELDQSISPRSRAMTKPTNNDFKISGEGNYEAAKRFDDAEKAFVKDRGDEIPALAKKAAEALDGPDGDSLRDASEAAARGQTSSKPDKQT